LIDKQTWVKRNLLSYFGSKSSMNERTKKGSNNPRTSSVTMHQRARAHESAMEGKDLLTERSLNRLRYRRPADTVTLRQTPKCVSRCERENSELIKLCAMLPVYSQG